MRYSARWARRAVIGGLVLMLVGFVDPLEGSLIVAPGAALLAIGGLLAHGAHRRTLYMAFALVVLGVATMWVMSALGGVGGSTGRSLWWALLVLPYPVGWILGLSGAVRQLRAGFPTSTSP
jgi:hypothetical protein